MNHTRINKDRQVNNNHYQQNNFNHQPNQQLQQGSQQILYRTNNNINNIPNHAINNQISDNGRPNLSNLLKREIGINNDNMYNQKPTDMPMMSILSNQPKLPISMNINKQIEEFGVIIAMKDTFGFIQPYHSEEQVYFSLDRDSYNGAQITDEVCYIKRASNKGYHAERVRRLNSNAKEIINDVKGIVIREPDLYKSLPGLLEITKESFLLLRKTNFLSVIEILGTTIYIPYLPNDLVISNNNNIKTSKRIFKGDEVVFSLCFIPRSTYYRGLSISFSQSKRDKLIQDQIQQMINAGITREQGIIDTIKANEYGFIKPVNRNYQIYFRLEDVIDNSIELVEDMEVEFFVIPELTKGKTSDRAVHLSILPKGTVQFEINIAKGTLGIIVNEPTNQAIEKPGKIKLLNPITNLLSLNIVSLEYIELWKRCILDDLLLYIGDTIQFDIQYYYPEKLFFARNINIHSYRKLSREYGTIVSLKLDSNFGFIKSYLREIDFYFRLNDIRDINGSLVNNTSLAIDDIVGFDICTNDELKSNNSKLRAVRAQLLTNDLMELKYIPIENNLIGKVMKAALYNKRDNSYQPGQIKMNIDDYSRIKDNNYYPTDIIKSLEEFINLPDITEISMKYLTSSQRKLYHSIIDSMFNNKLEHKLLQLPPGSVENSDPAKGRVLKISKRTIENEISSSPKNIKLKNNNTSNSKNSPVLSASNSGNDLGQDTDIVLYQRYDANDIYGPITKDLIVVYDLYIDKRTNKKVGRNVRLTDDPIVEFSDDLLTSYMPIYRTSYLINYLSNYLINQTTKQTTNDTSNSLTTNLTTNVSNESIDIDSFSFGVIDSIVGVKSGRFGFIRKLINDEKIFYHSTSIQSNDQLIDIDNIQTGQEVAFQLRRRGGIRCACNIILLPHQVLSNEIITQSIYQGIVIDSNHVILLYINKQNIEYYYKYWNVNYLTNQLIDEKPNSDIKYFPLLSRDSIEYISDISTQPGDLITCQLVVNWSTSRQPINAINLTKQSNNVIKGKGVLTKVKFKKLIDRNDSEDQVYNSLEFCEIKIIINNKLDNQADSNELFYCLYNEIIMKENCKDHIQEGDLVEFYPISDKKLAVHVVYLPKVSFRGPSTEVVKGVKPKYGLHGITMAKGPPQDTAVGFEKGWREKPDISVFEWSHLLSHMA